jgi:hypothetical protein
LFAEASCFRFGAVACRNMSASETRHKFKYMIAATNARHSGPSETDFWW